MDPPAAPQPHAAAGRCPARARGRSLGGGPRCARPPARSPPGRGPDDRGSRGGGSAGPGRTRSAVQPTERLDRAASALHLGGGRPEHVQGDQGPARGHGQRRRPHGRDLGPAPLPAPAGRGDRGPAAEGHGPGLGAGRHRARSARQPGGDDVRAAAGRNRGPGRVLRVRPRCHGRPEVLGPGGGGRGPDQPGGLRAADHHVAGGPAEHASAVLQRRGHQRAGPAVPALPDGPAHAGDLPAGAAGPEAGARHRDHELRRRPVLRADRRLRRDARCGGDGRRPRGLDRGARLCRGRRGARPAASRAASGSQRSRRASRASRAGQAP